MPTRRDLTGYRSGKLVAVEYIMPRRRWRCACDCGNESFVTVTALRKREIVSCGCWRKERPSPSITHGMTHSPEYYSWRAMKRRCLAPNASQYRYYGGRGIRICRRWIDSFEAFFADMGPKPTRKHSIERNNTNGDYTPDNCCWATQEAQNNNHRNTRIFTVAGVTGPVSLLARLHGMPVRLIRERLDRGFSIDRALSQPLRPTKPSHLWNRRK